LGSFLFRFFVSQSIGLKINKYTSYKKSSSNVVKSLSENEEFDFIIAGDSPSGLNTAIMCATRNLKVLLLERNKIGGLLATLYPNRIIPNYPSFPKGIVA